MANRFLRPFAMRVPLCAEMSNTIKLSLALLAALAVACGDEAVNLGNDGGNNGDGGNNSGDGGVVVLPNCTPGSTQCSDCKDNDGDGLADGFDPECTGAADNREDSFATGLSGDNIDVGKQDCFFDGDSGEGNDGCSIHPCCLLGAPTQADCPAELKPQQYDPADCTLDPNNSKDAMCIETCGAATPPGCDCFGCCTICNTDGVCRDIAIHPAISPNCDVDVLTNPDLCKPCMKIEECSSECNINNCILCPGQTPDDLPASCQGNNVCPGGITSCDSSADCASNEFCNNGCCLLIVG